MLLAAGSQSIVTAATSSQWSPPDRPGLFARVARACCALHGLDVVEAAVASEDGWAIEVFRVVSSFGPTFTWTTVVPADLHLALAGRLALRARLADRAGPTARRGASRRTRSSPRSTSTWAPSTDGHGRRGARLDSLACSTGSPRLADLDLDITGAKVQTLGSRVVDSFYVRTSQRATKITDEGLLGRGTERALLHALTRQRRDQQAPRPCGRGQGQARR
jgi:[protein-PII] uridylyltransferase